MQLRMQMSRGQWAILIAIALLVQIPFVIRFLRPHQLITASVPFADDFERTEIGPNYVTGGGFWRIVDGTLQSPGVKNNPLWLNAALPDEVAIEFDVWSNSKDGDIKCELFGNGWEHASGYVVVLGGWSNKTSIIARLDEHGRDRVTETSFKVKKGQRYHLRIERRAGQLDVLVDAQKRLSFKDEKPLRGPGNDRFGFSSWDSELFFDNLEIAPL
ncbi:MAG: hypothetical protein LBM75_04330 [Myxococcales bacterium]|jgi:hypothetical protein|nr:hypothetical protein [Myxococcales bacterium]